MIDVRVVATPAAAARHAARAVEEIVAGYTGPVLFLISGGSPLEILKFLSPSVFDARVTVGVSDDRFTKDPAINNFSQIMHLPAKHWIDTRPRPRETVEDAGRRFDGALKKWRKENPMGKIVMTQGIGLDGHTVGMIGRIFDDPNVWAVGYKAENKYPLRVTVTLPFLRMVDDSVLFVCGPDKAEPLSRTLAKDGDLAYTPARIIHEMKHCLLFTDQSV